MTNEKAEFEEKLKRLKQVVDCEPSTGLEAFGLASLIDDALCDLWRAARAWEKSEQKSCGAKERP